MNNVLFDFEFFNDYPDLCFLISSRGKIFRSNKISHQIFNLPEHEINGKNIIDFVELSYKNNTIDIFKSSIAENKLKRNTIKFNIHEKILYLEVTIVPNCYSSDESTGKHSLLICKDITELVVKEDELRKFMFVAENTVNPIQITDLEGNMIYVNPAFVHASGYSKEELIGQKPSIFKSGKHHKKFWAKMWETINSGKVWFGEIENKKKDGEPFFTQLLISPIINSEGNITGFFGVHRDLSDKRILEKQLIHTQKMESIGTLAAGIAHEVGNPLASISAIVQVVQRSTNDEFVNEKLSLVKSQVTRISKIIRDLVDFSRPSNYELKVTDINANITEAVEITKVGSKAKNIEFILDLNKNVPPLPLISDQLQQIFVNILLNAVDAINEVDYLPHPQIKVQTDVYDENVLITLSDNGAGIPEDNLSKIFEPFFTTKKEGRGTGLGLWVSYGIIKSFQGDITVSSKKDLGTTFSITIPIQS